MFTAYSPEAIRARSHELKDWPLYGPKNAAIVDLVRAPAHSAPQLTQGLRDKSILIDDIEDEGLRRPFQEFRDYWLSLDDSDDPFAIADLVC